MSASLLDLPQNHPLWRTRDGAVTAYIALGANLGDASQTLREAVSQLTKLSGVQLVACSDLYRTAPVDASGPDFLNAVVKVFTTLSPAHLLQTLQSIELAFGRQRPYRNAPRTLDLDLLLYADQFIQNERLTVPHPRINERAFVLLPLAEITPDRVTAAQRQAVQAQRIEKIQGPEWAGVAAA